MNLKIIIGSIFMALVLEASSLKVSVKDIDTSRGGKISVYIFAKDGFPKEHSKALYMQTKDALLNKLDFTFKLAKNLEQFAIKVHHDENNDAKVSKNWTGIYPSEGLGFSNEQTLGMFGPPCYKKSKISLDDIKSRVQISVVYP